MRTRTVMTLPRAVREALQVREGALVVLEGYADHDAAELDGPPSVAAVSSAGPWRASWPGQTRDDRDGPGELDPYLQVHEPGAALV